MNKSELVERVADAAYLEQRANVATSDGVKFSPANKSPAKLSAKSAKSTKKR